MDKMFLDAKKSINTRRQFWKEVEMQYQKCLQILMKNVVHSIELHDHTTQRLCSRSTFLNKREKLK